MNLPNRELAFVPRAKIDDYLLSESHPVGGAKAKFFRAFGFNETTRNLLEQALLDIARTAPVNQVKEGDRGTKYIMSGAVQTPIGRIVPLQTVWIIERGETAPRFVTAYPE